MGELKDYLTLFQQLQKDERLMRLISEYETEAAQLQTLLLDPDYDAAEAIRLTNDIEYLSSVIANDPLYRSFAEAKEKMERAAQIRAAHFDPNCNCAACQKARARKPYEETK